MSVHIIPTLRSLDFDGTDAAVLAQTAKQALKLLSSFSSASCMWIANAATVLPSGDTKIDRLADNVEKHIKIDQKMQSNKTNAIQKECR